MLAPPRPAGVPSALRTEPHTARTAASRANTRPAAAAAEDRPPTAMGVDRVLLSRSPVPGSHAASAALTSRSFSSYPSFPCSSSACLRVGSMLYKGTRNLNSCAETLGVKHGKKSQPSPRQAVGKAQTPATGCSYLPTEVGRQLPAHVAPLLQHAAWATSTVMCLRRVPIF